MSTNQTQYGRFPGVRVNVTGGSISNTQIGREQKLVLFGRGDTDEGSAEENEYEQIRSRVQAAEYFGQGSPLADGIEKALNNKGSYEFIYGVAPAENDVSAESVMGGAGNLESFPIVEDTALIDVVHATDGTQMNVEFRYESPPDAPEDAEVVYLNPLTGELTAANEDEYEVSYTYLDWEGAFDSADQILNHAEVGVYAALSDSEDVALSLSRKLSGDPSEEDDRGLRGEYKLVMGVAGAQPNATNDDGEPIVNPETYSDAIDDDAMFLAAPARMSGENSDRTLIPGIAGRFAGNELDNPFYGDSILGYDRLTQALTRSEQQSLRDLQVMPVVDDYRDSQGEGITVEGHHSTSTATDWARTFQNRRLTDLVILAQRQIAEAARDNLMRDQQLDEIESQIINTFERMARRGLIHGDPDGEGNQGRVGDLLSGIGQDAQQVGDNEQPYFAEAVRSDVNTISVGSGFTPVGVTTGVDVSITVADNVGTFQTQEGDN